MISQTLLLIKPDGIKKKIIGNIITKLENNNLDIIKIKIIKLDKNKAIFFYNEHKDKPFFNELVEFITSYKIMALILEGNNSIIKVRELIGSTNYKLAKKDTIREKWGSSITENVVHASDSLDSFKKEVKIIFND